MIIVKSVDWIKRQHDYEIMDTAFGEYSAFDDSWLAPEDKDLRPSFSLQESKCKCEDHYQSKVLSLIVSAE